MKKEEILTLEIRRKIFNYILDYPGLHFRELCRQLQIPKSTLSYHLNYLQKRGLLIAKSVGGYLRYYAQQKVSNFDKQVLNLLRQEIPRDLIIYIRLNPDSSRKEICREFGKGLSTIHFQLNKLMKIGILDRIQHKKEIKYRIWDDKSIDKILIQYKKSLLSNVVIQYVDWVGYVHSDMLLYWAIKLNKSTDGVIKGLLEIFPHPYHA